MVGRERAIIFEGSVGDDGSPDVSTCMSSRCWDSGVARVVLMVGHARGRDRGEVTLSESHDIISRL